MLTNYITYKYETPYKRLFYNIVFYQYHGNVAWGVTQIQYNIRCIYTYKSDTTVKYFN